MPTQPHSIRKAILFCLLLLLIAMPYSTLVWQVFRHALEVGGYPLNNLAIKATVAWKEILLCIIVFLFLVLWIGERRFPFTLTKLDIYLLLFMTFGVVIGGLITRNVSWIVFGFRYDFSPLLYYLAARSVILSREQFLRIGRILLNLSLPILIFGLLQTFYLPREFLERFGYSWGGSVTGNPLPPYHLVAGFITRAMATFPGPNSFGMYAVGIFFLSVTIGRHVLPRIMQLLLPLLSLVGLVLSFSRGHLISLILAAILGLIFYWAKRFSWRTMITSALALGFLGLGLLGVIYFGSLKPGEVRIGVLSYVLHQESSEIHKKIRLEAWEDIQRHPLGSGLGSSGLATTNTGGPVFNPESWYIQITQELGWLGLLAALSLLVIIYWHFSKIEKNLFQEIDRRLLFFFIFEFSAIAMSVNFLPSWFEVTSLIWWILFGFFLTDFLRCFPRSEILFFGSTRRHSS